MKRQQGLRKSHHGGRGNLGRYVVPKAGWAGAPRRATNSALLFSVQEEARSPADSGDGEGRTFSDKLPSAVFQLVSIVRKLFVS